MKNRHRKLWGMTLKMWILILEDITIDFVKEKQQMMTKFEDYKKIFIEELKVREHIQNGKFIP